MLKKTEKRHTKVDYITAFCCFFIDLNIEMWYFRSILRKKRKKGEWCL